MIRARGVIALVLAATWPAAAAGAQAQPVPLAQRVPLPQLVPLAPRPGYRHPPAPRAADAAVSRAEAATARRFDQARQAGALSLYEFLERMPKGADLHMHLAGAVYAETLIKDAVEDHLCLDPARMALAKNAGPAAADGGSAAAPPPRCADGQVPAAAALHDQKIYDALVDSFSLRAFVPTPGVNGHDQFFATFARFGAVSKAHAGEWLDEVATRAAAQNIQYLEVMQTPTFSHAARLGKALGWPGTETPESTAASSVAPAPDGASPIELAALRNKLLHAGLREEVTVDRAEFARALAERNRRERCGTAAAAAACAVQLRFLYQVLRAFAPQQVFAQALLAFEVAATDPEVAGINFVQPEDAYESMTEYHRQMQMLDYLHSVYPAVRISLHAGELAPGLVPPAGLSFHIREAVELGHAQRIGHGVDVMYEADPERLLRELARRHVMVEINLTSNDIILGVGPNQHSLPVYLAAQVPVALSTDDEGVSRIDLTHEYARAATDFHLGYIELKRMARTSLEHAFLPGASLWARPDNFNQLSAACAHDHAGSSRPSERCAALLAGSARAAEQWELERRFRQFESPAPAPTELP